MFLGDIKSKLIVFSNSVLQWMLEGPCSSRYSRNQDVKTVMQTDRDIGRHDKLKHLVIKSKCSQERFQAKQS